jgi:hypothetical protein|tara:strand:+ start:4154 stop:4342 length:189 start_codon:yes stop_codon:yes gene_type:complete
MLRRFLLREESAVLWGGMLQQGLRVQREWEQLCEENDSGADGDKHNGGQLAGDERCVCQESW